MYAIDSTVLKPPSTTNLISRAVKPLTPYLPISLVSYIGIACTRTSSAATGVGAPGAPIVLSSYCSSSADML